MKPHEIISDLEIIKVHGNANFGTSAPRDVVNGCLLKAACGYGIGSTATAIILEHELVTQSSKARKFKLTDKGRKYLYAAYNRGTV